MKKLGLALNWLLIVVTLGVPGRAALAAPLNLPCDWKSTFMISPVKKQRIGYLTDFHGLGLSQPLTKDLTLEVPYTSAKPREYAPLALTGQKAKVVGVIENVSWDGGVGDPWSFSVYVAPENANLLKAQQVTALKNTSIQQLGFWVGNFDEEAKVWFEQAFPHAPALISGALNAPSAGDVRLHVSDVPVPVAPNVDIKVVKVTFEVVPAANHAVTIHAATSSTKSAVEPWGLVVGGLAK